jgi:fructose-bisphosphate aldolase, class II
MAMTGQIRKVLSEDPGEFDPRKYLKPAMEAMAKLCKQRLQEFNAAGQAGKIKKGADPGRDGEALCRRGTDAEAGVMS